MRNISKKFFIILSLILSGCFQKKNTILKIGNAADPATLDPQLATGLPEAKVITSLFEGLLIPDSQTLKPTYGMAHAYEISSDGRKYKFFLRNNAIWSDGSPVTAQDFVDAIQRGLSPQTASPWREFYFLLKNAQRYYKNDISSFSKVGIEAISSKVLELTLEEPLDYFPSLLTHWAWFPVHRESIEKSGNFFDRNNPWTKADNIVSNGPYLLKSVEIGGKIVLEKNKQYWDAKNVKIDHVHIISGIDSSTEENMFITGQLDITDNVPSDKIKHYCEQGTLQPAISLGSVFYWFNCQKEPFNDTRVRQALSLAIDRNAIGNLRNRGSGFEAYSVVPPGTMNYTCQNLFQVDIEGAKRLLADAGYPNGKNFPQVTLLYNTSDNLKIIGEAVQEMWRKNLNIQINLQSLEWGVFLNERRQHKFDICRGNWIGDYNDATTFLNLFLSDSDNNHGQWKHKAYNQLLKKASDANNFSQRSEILAQAEKLMIDEMPIIPIYFESICHLVSKRVKGWYPNILDQHLLKYIYFEK